MSAAATERVGRYQLLEPIGHGPSGTVSRAKVFGVAGFERQFAIKRFHPEVTATAVLAQALSVAARAYGSLEHPRIARMSEFGVAQGTTFTAVEFVIGLDAMRLVAEARLAGAALPAGGALALVSQAARAVGYAHGRGLTHLGLAPTNVMITVDGDIKLTDFGILSASLPQRPTDTPRLANRIPYLAPEQLANEATSAATDVFALGVLAFELISGQRTFRGETPQQIAQSVMGGPPGELPLPRPILRVLQRCLARSPFERFPDARALADALDAALRVAPIPGTRKDIGAQVKHTMERMAALHESELSGVLALDLGTGPIQRPAPARSAAPVEMRPLEPVPRDFQDALEPETHEFERPESMNELREEPAAPGLAALLAAARPSAGMAASTVPDLQRPGPTTMAGLPPPPIPVPPGISSPPNTPPPAGVGSSTLVGFSNKPTGPRPIAPIPEPPSSTLARAPTGATRVPASIPPAGLARTQPRPGTPPPIPPRAPGPPSPPSFPGPLGTPASATVAAPPRPTSVPPEVPPGLARPTSHGTLPSSLFARPPSGSPQTIPGAAPPPRPTSEAPVPAAPSVEPAPAPEPAAPPARPGTDLAIAFDGVHDEESEHNETLLQLASAAATRDAAAERETAEHDAVDSQPDAPGPGTPMPSFVPLPALDMRRAPAPTEPPRFSSEPANPTPMPFAAGAVPPPVLAAGPAFDDTASPVTPAFDDTASSPLTSDDTASQFGSTIPEGSAAQLGSVFPDDVPQEPAGYAPSFAPARFSPARFAQPDHRAPGLPISADPALAEPPPQRNRAGTILLGTVAAAGLAVGGWFAYGEYMSDGTAERGATSAAGSGSAPAVAPKRDSGPPAVASNPPPKPGSKPVPTSGSNTGSGSASPGGDPPKALDSLSIISTPPGARVFLDGADVGVTPLEVEGSPDRHTVALYLTGHELVIAQIDGHRQFSFDLKALNLPTAGQAGIKVIRCKNTARYYVYVDGKPTGMTCPTERIFTTLGPHTVEVYDLITEARKKWNIEVKDTRLSHRVRVE